MASKITATEKELGEIHEYLTDYYKTRLQAARASGEPIPPAELSAINTFLKNNGIECTKQDIEEKFGQIRELKLPAFEEIEADIG